MDDLRQHPAVIDVRLVGSRADGRATDRSDYDFAVRTNDLEQLKRDLPGLLGDLDPLAEQWDRLSDEMCWMVMLPGPVKVDVIFPSERHEHEPPWRPSCETLPGIDAHFWDWALWLRAKEARGKNDLVFAQLLRLHEHLLRPMGVPEPPSSIGEAVASFRTS